MKPDYYGWKRISYERHISRVRMAVVVIVAIFLLSDFGN